MKLTKTTVDIRGLICPAPVIKVTKVARALHKGDELVILMDLDGKTNVEGWARGNNFEITDFKKEDDRIVFTLEKKDG